MSSSNPSPLGTGSFAEEEVESFILRLLMRRPHRHSEEPIESLYSSQLVTAPGYQGSKCGPVPFSESINKQENHILAGES